MNPEHPPIDEQVLTSAARDIRPVRALFLGLFHRLATVCSTCETSLACATSWRRERELRLPRLQLLAHQIDSLHRRNRGGEADAGGGGDAATWSRLIGALKDPPPVRMLTAERAAESVRASAHLTEAEVEVGQKGRCRPLRLALRVAAHLREVDPASRETLDALISALDAALTEQQPTSSAG